MSNISFVEGGGISKTIPTREISIDQALDIISSKRYKEIITEIRNCKTKEERDELKKKLDYFIFGGTFETRANKKLNQSSGVLVLDYDDTATELKDELIKDEYVHFIFVSPSGNGFKVGVKIPEVKDDAEYKQYWNAVSNHFNIEENDEKTKDIARACFVSYDEEVYYNPTSKVFDNKEELVNTISKKQNTEDDDFIKSVKEKWNEGDRQELAMSLAGYLRKNKKLGEDNASEIIKQIIKKS